MSVTIKIFYEKSTGSPEIRRFPLDPNSGDCFVQAKDKIKKLYTALASGAFQLFWKDSDGDRIAFSSAEEMKDALSYVTDGVFRVYIPEVKETSKPKENVTEEKTNTSQQQQQQQQQQGQTGASSTSSSSWSSSSSSSQSQPQQPGEDTLHPNIICDGCEGPVIGVRFKCCICPDFDLCSGCEKKGLHSEHDMIKMTAPRMSGPFGFLPPDFANYIHTGAHNAAHAAAQAAASAAASSFGQPGCPPGPAGQGNNQNRPEGQGRNDDYLRNVGANIAAFLDPFGIDVTYDVHHNNGDRQQQQQQQGGRWSGSCGVGGGSPGHFWRGGRGGGCAAWQGMGRRCGQPKNPGAESGDATSNTATTAGSQKKEKSSKDVDAMETDDASTTTSPTTSQDNNNTPAGQGETKGDNSKVPSRPGSDEWTFVPDDGSEIHVTPPNPSTPIPMPAPPTSTTQTQPQDQNSTSTPAHGAVPPRHGGPGGIYPDLRLQQSLDQMLAMGFSNADNWLSDLLMENRCDIGQTLDAVKAKATQQLDSLRK